MPKKDEQKAGGVTEEEQRRSANPRRAYGFFKRLMDVFLCLLLLILLSPVLLGLMLLIWAAFGRPIIFRQARLGFEGREFTIFKFRTMTDARDAQGALLPDEARVTRLGTFLRSISLDELPELVNVLKGEMSLVGPRPLPVFYGPRYSPEQNRRHEVKPGITGWAQINGRNAITWEQKFAHDVWYVDHASLLLDLRILAVTALKTLSREGISQPGFATAEEFMGTEIDSAPKDRPA